MRIHRRIALATTLATTLSINIASTRVAADATVIDELVVYGSRSAFTVELDLAPLRIDLRQHRLEVGDSVRSALAESSKPRRAGDAEVAIATSPSRG
jgi:hypothetical protein